MSPPRNNFVAPLLVAFLLGVSATKLLGDLLSPSPRQIYTTVCGDTYTEDPDQILKMHETARVALGDMGQDITVEVSDKSDVQTEPNADGDVVRFRPTPRPIEVADTSDAKPASAGSSNAVLVRAGPRLIQVIAISSASQIELCALHGEKQLGILVRDIPDADLLRVGSTSPVFYEQDPLSGLFTRRRRPVLVLPASIAKTKPYSVQIYRSSI